MRFLECVDINPKITMTKGQLYPFVEMANVSTCYRSPDNVETKPFDSGVKFQDGDTVIARITPCLQNGKRFYCQNIGTGFGSTEYLVFRPKDDSVDNKYLYYFMMTDFVKQSMINSMTGATGRQRVNNYVFNDIEVCFPDIDIQRRIGEILSAYDSLIENNQKQIKLLEEAAQRLYKEWFVDLHFPGWENTKIVDGVPEGWEKSPVGKYLKVKSGYAFKSGWWQKSGYPVVKIKNIVGNIVDISDVDYVAPERTYKIPDFRLQKGDVVIAMTGATIGKVGLVPDIDNLFTNQRVGKIFPCDEITNPTPFAFCFYSQEAVQERVLAISSASSAQPNISGGQLESFTIIANIKMLNLYCKCTQPNFDRINALLKQNRMLIQARDRLLPKLMSGEIEV